MENLINEIEKKALQLPKKDRGLLAERLLKSIDDNSLTDIDEMWVQEAEKRYNDYISGKTEGLPGDKVISDIKRELGWQK
jgi:putative addiction module component (TIGR02574 family)